MMRGPALPCPTCKRRLKETDWIDDRSCRCEYCNTYYDGLVFPAATRTRRAAKPQAVEMAEDSSCFFHTQNQAEKVCEGCGRFLCSVCAIPMPGGLLCPNCIAAQKTKSPVIVSKRVLFDGLALTLAFVPLLMWPVTLVTAPMTVILVIYGWNKPSSLVRGRRTWKMIVAGLAGLLQFGLWCFFGAKLLLR